MSCKKAQEFLESNAWDVAAQTDASKERRGRQEALALAKQADTVVVAKGKKVFVFDMTAEPPEDELLAAHILGPTGNLRAPALRIGRKLVVGFSEAAYRQMGEA
jgi:hypothetical protein